MSDKTGVPRPSRGGSSVILTGLAVGALLSAAPPAAAAPAVVEIIANQACAPAKLSSEVSATTTIREQFQGSFTAGALTPPVRDLPAVICETK
jgi:hypothetical protein